MRCSISPDSRMSSSPSITNTTSICQRLEDGERGWQSIPPTLRASPLRRSRCPKVAAPSMAWARSSSPTFTLGQVTSAFSSACHQRGTISRRTLTLSYTTGAANGAFGLGWSLGIPNISRKISKGVPVYDDERDTFMLSGADELVPVQTPCRWDEAHNDVSASEGRAVRPDHAYRRRRPQLLGRNLQRRHPEHLRRHDERPGFQPGGREPSTSSPGIWNGPKTGLAIASSTTTSAILVRCHRSQTIHITRST